jgi:hypothetical protein
VGALLVVMGAQAAPSVPELASRLAKSDDFRVRAQAALALGASGDSSAVDPLCKGLADSSTTVRVASAVALGRLAAGGGECLSSRLEVEPSDKVKQSIQTAIAKLSPGLDDATRYYIAIGTVADETGRGKGAVEAIVRGPMSKALKSLDGFALAPSSETRGQAEKLLSKHPKVKGFFLAPRVLKPAYTGGNLKVKMEIALFTYPGKSLLGSYSVKLTQQGVSDTDSEAENGLFEMIAERAIQKLPDSVSQL